MRHTGENEMNEDVVDLGWMNGWGQDKPQEYRNCTHDDQWERTKLGRSIEKVTCRCCKISWCVDSSD